MASPFLHARFEPRLYERVMAAVRAEGSSLSEFLRAAVEAKLGAVEREAAERAALLAEARSFLADPGEDREAASLVSRYVAAVEAQVGRLSLAEQRGRQRAVAEIAGGALKPLDGAELEVVASEQAAWPVVLETTTPRRRGFLKAALAAERARALLQAAPPVPPPPSAAGLLGEARTRQLWGEAVSWPGWRRVFCSQHGIVPSAPSSDGARCYLGCTLPSAPEVA